MNIRDDISLISENAFETGAREGTLGAEEELWLADPETNTYGGAYIWQDREAMKAYAETDIYKGMATNPHFEGVTVKDFAVLENPTHITWGLAGVA